MTDGEFPCGAELDNVANQHGVPKSANNEINQQVNKRI